MISKFSFQVANTTDLISDKLSDFLQKTQPAIIVSRNSVEVTQSLLNLVREYSPFTTVFHHVLTGSIDDVYSIGKALNHNGTFSETMRDWYKHHQGVIEKIPDAVIIPFAYSESSAKVREFEAKMIPTFNQFGLTIGLPFHTVQTYSHFRQMRYIFELIREHYHYITWQEAYEFVPYLNFPLNGYPNSINTPILNKNKITIANHVPFPKGDSRPGLHIGSHRQILRIMEQEWLWTDIPPIAITSWGIGNPDDPNALGNDTGTGWRDKELLFRTNREKFQSMDQSYIQDAVWCNDHIYNHPSVIGFAMNRIDSHTEFDPSERFIDQITHIFKAKLPNPNPKKSQNYTGIIWDILRKISPETLEKMENYNDTLNLPS